MFTFQTDFWSKWLLIIILYSFKLLKLLLILMKNLVLIVAVFGLFSIFSSCNKAAGEGGTSVIKGRVYVQNYNSAGTAITAEYYGQDVEVYIIYGTKSNFFNDRIRTSYDGSFEFPYLAKGSYRIFVYEQCFNTVDNPCPSGMREVLVKTDITKNKSTVDVGTITIKD